MLFSAFNKARASACASLIIVSAASHETVFDLFMSQAKNVHRRRRLAGATSHMTQDLPQMSF
jgi:hypothetical protein